MVLCSSGCQTCLMDLSFFFNVKVVLFISLFRWKQNFLEFLLKKGNDFEVKTMSHAKYISCGAKFLATQAAQSF